MRRLPITVAFGLVCAASASVVLWALLYRALHAVAGG